MEDISTANVCDVCDMQFTKKNALQRHVRSVHTGKRHLCKSAYNRKDALDVSNSATFTCAECKQTSCSRSALRLNERSQHKDHSRERTLQCNICGRAFAAQTHFNKHVPAHSTDHPKFSDIECKQALGEKDALLRHDRAEFAGTNTFKCSMCIQVFLTNDAYTQHLVKHTPLRRKSLHDDASNDVDDDTAAPLTTSLICRTMDGEDRKIVECTATPEEEEASDVTTFACPHCAMEFATTTSLEEHMRQSHVHKSYLKFTCEILEYECDQCQRKYSCVSTLNRHVRSHTEGKKYECPTCQRRFGQKAVLSRHSATHAAQKPFACSQCDRSYAQKKNLVAHVNYHHSENPIVEEHKCFLCDKVYRYSSGLRRHVLKHASQWPEHVGQEMQQTVYGPGFGDESPGSPLLEVCFDP